MFEMSLRCIVANVPSEISMSNLENRLCLVSFHGICFLCWSLVYERLVIKLELSGLLIFHIIVLFSVQNLELQCLRL